MGNSRVIGVYSIEAGCLGPNGSDLVEEFCSFSQKELANLNSEFICWMIVPRYDKSVPEVQYKVNNKSLTQSMASRYFAAFDEDIEEYEADLHRIMGSLIERYSGR